jgi:hypothetical protein
MRTGTPEDVFSPRKILSAYGVPMLIDDRIGLEVLNRQLALSGEQTGMIQAMRDRYFRDTKALRYDILAKRLEMRRLFSDPAATRVALLDKQRELNSLWDRLTGVLIQASIDARQGLTAEQIEKLERLTTP